MSRKVLIVEDEPELLTLMADSFRRADVEVYTARNGEVGLELFRAVRPDLVITDIVMPAKEGVALIMDIRKTGSDAPVIAISGGGARSCKDYLRWAKELGAALVLQKPFRMSILLMMARFLMDKAAHAGPVQSIPALVAASAATAGEPFDELFEPPHGSPLPTF